MDKFMTFSSWLEKELKTRAWSQKDLVRSARSQKYKIAPSQLSFVLNGSRLPSPETCIAIAAGLGIAREEVFRARGWLEYKTDELVPATAKPSVAKLINDLTSLENETQERVIEALQVNLDTILHFVKEQRAPYGKE